MCDLGPELSFWQKFISWKKHKCPIHGTPLIDDVIPNTAAGGVGGDYWYSFCWRCEPEKMYCFVEEAEWDMEDSLALRERMFR